ncbi:5'-methylthioadenosine/adenosylhomocysteine nucleosidase [Halotalea alkalilenta]|uniref:5'-methylthioadenosine/adenosylhomocysteine nucleosidase n=1 Tax=Halotalea alkalilenta TaxID=376489 RepID=UPI0005BCD3AD|nr:5'-methylthioadenosine/adenosylhomocysteine nucleosidase [Halotalea alkalilenta]
MAAGSGVRVALIGAMTQEVDALLAHLESTERLEHGGSTFHLGRLRGIEVVVLESGIGKVNAAIATTLAFERFAPRAVINVGSAGGFGDRLAIGDVVISSEVCHHDVDVTPFGYALGQVPGMPARFAADPRLVALAREALQGLDGITAHEGLIGSGDVFVAGGAAVSSLRGRFPEMIAAEMEAAAVAQTCHRHGCPFVVTRAVSDLPEREGNSVDFETFLGVAAANSARMVASMLERLD